MTENANIFTLTSLDDLCHDQNVPLPADNEGIMVVVCSPEGHIRAHVLRIGIMTEGRLEMHQMILYKALIAARARARKPIPEGMMEGDNVVV